MERFFESLLAPLRAGRAEASSSIRHSIVRRSLWLTGFVVLGHCFYYLLVLSANRMLDPEGFGRFYAGWAVLNILVTPTSAVIMLLTGILADVWRIDGIGAVAVTLGRVAKTLGAFAFIIVIAAEIFLYFGGKMIGIDSFGLVILLPITAASFVAVETARTAFAATLQTAWFGASWVLWCFAQCLLGITALVAFNAPWAVFAGMLVANLVVFAILVVTILSRSRASRMLPAAAPDLDLSSFRGALPFCTAFAGFVAFNNADVLVAYLVMDPPALGAYAAAALLPKAIVTVTQPVAQAILPVLINVRAGSARVRYALMKSVAITFALAAAGAIILWCASPVVCGGRYGIEFCSATPMITLAVAAVFFAVMRVLIIAEVSRSWYVIAHLPYVMLIGFAAVELLRRPPGGELAMHFVLAALASLAAIALANVVQWLRGAEIALRS